MTKRMVDDTPEAFLEGVDLHGKEPTEADVQRAAEQIRAAKEDKEEPDSE